jgi:hypothetical protein
VKVSQLKARILFWNLKLMQKKTIQIEEILSSKSIRCTPRRFPHPAQFKVNAGISGFGGKPTWNVRTNSKMKF